MAIKEIPTNFRVYYKSMKDAIRPKYEKAVDDYEKGLVEEKALYDEIKLKVETYRTVYKFDLMQIPEFVENKYIDGTFYDSAKELFLNRKKAYIATNPDWVCPTWYGYAPDCGSISEMLARALQSGEINGVRMIDDAISKLRPEEISKIQIENPFTWSGIKDIYKELDGSA